MATPSRPELEVIPDFNPLDFTLESLEIEQFNLDPPQEADAKYAIRSDTSTNCCTDNCTIHCSDPCSLNGGVTCFSC